MIEYDTFVLDLDGTVYLDGVPYPGVRESIIELQRQLWLMVIHPI